MTQIKHLFTMIIFSLLLMSCSDLPKQVHENSPNESYSIAQKNLRDGNWKQAIAQLETLNDRYPFSPYSQQAKVDLIYLYYKNNELSIALNTIDRFIRLNPTYPNIDYILYMRGLINMSLDDNAFWRFFGIDRSDRDPQYALEAFKDFSKLTRNYPHSQYFVDASKHLSLLKERLAKYEYSVASYYARCGAWIAAINRIKGILRNYPDTKTIQNGLKLMENACHHMQKKSLFITNDY